MKRWFSGAIGLLGGWGISTAAIAQSIVPANDGTGTTVTPTGDVFEIEGGQRSPDNANLFHSFQRFDVGAGETARFISSPEFNNILSRVTGGDPSTILGLIEVVGGTSNLYLMNPAGIVFGASAQLNVPADFIATTATGIELASGNIFDLQTLTWSELVGDPTSFVFALPQNGAIVNDGALTVASDRTLALLGGVVTHTGQLSAPGGNIVLAAVPGSSRLRLSVPGNLLSLEIEPTQMTEAGLTPLTLPELLTGGANNQLAVNPDGTVSVVGSTYRVRPRPGTSIVSGQLDVSADIPQDGAIAILGDRVAAISARLDASAPHGGGRIFIGGDFRGGGRFPQAEFTFIDPFSWLVADALGSGDGGQVVVWSRGTTVFSGNARARGLENGGFVEISGGDRLVFRGTVDVSGATPGTVLFDPDDILVDEPLPPPEDDFTDEPPPPEDDFTDEPPPPPEDDFGDEPPPPEDDFGDEPPPPEDDFTDEPPPPEDDFGDEPPPPEDDFTDEPPPEDDFGDEPPPPEDDFGDEPPPPEDDFTDEPPPPLEDDFGDEPLPPLEDDFTDEPPPPLEDDFGDEPLPPEDDFRDDPPPRQDGNVPPPRDNFEDFIDGVAPQNVTITPEAIANIAGYIIFEASNDITVTTPIVNPAGVELRAGRNLTLNANINTVAGPGSILLFANDETVAGNQRQSGPANLIQAPGTRLDSAFGDIVLQIGNAGPVGNVRLGTIFTQGVVTVDANGGNIVRTGPNATVNAETAFLSTFGTGGIGTPREPLNVSAISLFVNTGRGGEFVNLASLEQSLGDLESDLQNLREASGELDGGPDGESGGDFGGEFGEFEDEGSGEFGDFEDDGAGEFGDFEDEGSGEFGDFEDEGSGEFGDFEDEGSDDSGDEDGGLDGESDDFDVETAYRSDVVFLDEVEAVASLEQDRLQEFSSYLGSVANTSISVASARESLAEIAAQTGTQSAVVYVTLLPTQLELVVFTAGERPIRRSVPVSRAEVLAVADELRSQLTNLRFRRTDGYLQPAQQLYQWAIAPILPELETANISTLLFSMPSGLRSLPVAALHNGEQFLIENFSLSLIPSLGLVDTRYRTLQDTRVLAMGASEFTDGLDPLPAVPLELRTIASQWWDGSTFLNEQFTRDNLVQQRQRYPYPIIHLATHGEFLDFNDSYIQLWNERLQLNELRQLGWNEPPVELVVLSACRTAVGNEEAELGFAGFAVAAGVKSALASLWYVSDEGTLALMSEFYTQLRQTTTKSEALRQAQLSLLYGDSRVENGRVRAPGLPEPLVLPERTVGGGENRDLSHPYFWAGFTMVGSPW